MREPRHLFLVGPRGSGKTTVARELGLCLTWGWVDLDHEIESRANRSIRAIFEQDGEPEFRRLERLELRAIAAQQSPITVATGGGIVLAKENRDLMKDTGRVVWLAADIDTLWRRVCEDTTTAERRPRLTVGGREELAELVAAREPLYRAVADYVVDTSTQSAEELAAEIAAWWMA